MHKYAVAYIYFFVPYKKVELNRGPIEWFHSNLTWVGQLLDHLKPGLFDKVNHLIYWLIEDVVFKLNLTSPEDIQKLKQSSHRWLQESLSTGQLMDNLMPRLFVRVLIKDPVTGPWYLQETSRNSRSMINHNHSRTAAKKAYERVNCLTILCLDSL